MGLITVRQYQHETKVHAKHLEIGEGILRLASRSLNLEYFEIFPLFGLSQWRHFTCLGQCGGVWCRTKRGEGESKLDAAQPEENKNEEVVLIDRRANEEDKTRNY